MLVRTSRGYQLFIHVPKTGGNTIQQCLLGHGLSVDQPICRGHQDGQQRFELRGPITETKHQPLQRYHQLSPATAGMPVAVCVRRPFERLVSLYFSPHRWLQWCSQRASYELPEDPAFDEAAFLQIVGAAPAAIDYLASGAPSVSPQAAVENRKNFEKLAFQARLAVLKTESLAADFAACFGFALSIQSRNVSPYRQQVRRILASRELRAWVEEDSHHQADLECFYGTD